MYWTDRVESIYNFLNSNGYSGVINKMIEEFGVGGTPGEQFSIVCVWLAKMRNHNHELYNQIKEHADKILQEGIDIKYFTDSYYKKL